MAVDTQNKRFSIANFGWMDNIFPVPDGVIDATNRAQFLGLYSGIGLDAPPVSAATLERMLAIGFLENLVTDVRLALDDPSVSAKWSSQQILRMAGMAFRRAFRDINIVSSHRIVLAHEVAVLSGTRRYDLPPVVGEVVNWGEWDDTLGSYKSQVSSRSRHSSARRGVFIDRNRLVFDTNPGRAFTLRIEYIPGPHFYPHAGQIDFSDVKYTTATSVTFNAVDKTLQTTTTVPFGDVHYAKDGFVGQILRIWPDDATAAQVVQDRIITAQVLAVGGTDEVRLTVDLPWDTTPGSTETWNYEILPEAVEGFRHVVVLGTAMTLCAMTGLWKKRQQILEEYVPAARTEKLYEAFYSRHQGGTWRTDSHEAAVGGFR